MGFLSKVEAGDVISLIDQKIKSLPNPGLYAELKKRILSEIKQSDPDVHELDECYSQLRKLGIAVEYHKGEVRFLKNHSVLERVKM